MRRGAGRSNYELSRALADAQAAIHRARALHFKRRVVTGWREITGSNGTASVSTYEDRCACCLLPYPCPTRQELRQERDEEDE